MIVTMENIHARCQKVGDCWEWTVPTDGRVPVLRYNGSRRLHPVRRAVMTLKEKPIDGLLVICTCRNPVCVNPAHLKAVTRAHLQKMTADETQYGKSIARSAALAAARRKQSGLVLSEERVAELRASGLTSRAAAKEFGCSQSAAWQAMSGRTWKDYRAPFAGMVGALTR